MSEKITVFAIATAIYVVAFLVSSLALMCIWPFLPFAPEPITFSQACAAVAVTGLLVNHGKTST